MGVAEVDDGDNIISVSAMYSTPNMVQTVRHKSESYWMFLLLSFTRLYKNLLPASIVLLLGVEGHYHYWDGIFPCLPAKLSMVKYIYQLRVALWQYRVETVTSDLINLGMT